MHSPLTSPSPKTSLPPTTKNRLRSEIDAKATKNVVGNHFAGCASCGSCGVGQPHELQIQLISNKNKNRRGLTPQKQRPYACQMFRVDWASSYLERCHSYWRC